MKLKRVLSLLMALVMTVSLMTLPVHAEDNDFASLTVAEQYAALKSVDNEADAQALFNTLTEAQQTALVTYAQTQAAGDTTPVQELNVVSSSVVAPLVKADSAEEKAVKKVQMRAALKVAPNPDSTDNKETDAGHEGLFTNKNVIKEDGSYTLKLESYVTGNVTISTETNPLPSDIVLVLDVSGSMDEYITVGSKNETSELDTKYGGKEGVYEYCSVGSLWRPMRYYEGSWQYNGLGGWKNLDQSHFGTQEIRISKMNALKIATKNFVDQVQVKAEKDGVDHKISIVKFAGDKKNTVGNEYYSYYYYNYSQTVLNLTSSSSAETIKSTINNLTAGGATAADYGMEHARDIINAVNRESNKVVIMFTDGEPNHENGFDPAVANATIAASKEIKAAGATVYTIGVFGNADDTVPMPTNATNPNKYMHYVSSNFKNANSMTDSGTATYPGGNQSYYLAANNADQINGIFKQISEQIATGGASRVLGSTSVVKDSVTEYFNVPEDTGDIKVYTAAYLGYNADGTRKFGTPKPYTNAQINIDGQTISVSNFDYSSDTNCVMDTQNADGTTTYTGNKLIIEFAITPKDDFLGGNQVPTNEAISGVYEKPEDTTPVGNFVVPKTNVPIKPVTVTAADKNVYLTGNLTEDQLMVGATVKCGDVDITNPDNLQPWQKAYVNINITASGLQNLTNDTTYTVNATVSPNNTSGTAVEQTGSATAKVNVFTPEVNFKDSTIYRGNTANYSINQTGAPVWKHRNTVDKEVDMSGTAPALTYSYDKGEDAFEDCTDVNVTVKIGSTNVTDKTTGDKLFTVHVLQPVITATVNDVERYYGESYTLGDGANGAINLTWTDTNNHSDTPAVTGSAPYTESDLSLAYSTAAFSDQTGIVPASDFDVTVKVMKNGVEMPATITTTCTHGCSGAQTDGKYTVHVNTCTLTVQKSGWDEKDANQSFIFNVAGGEIAQNIKVTVQENGSATIVGLPVGSYTVTEVTSWSWRYNPDSQEETVNVQGGPDNTVTFHNTRTATKWLSGDNYAVNHVGGIKAQGTFVGA